MALSNPLKKTVEAIAQQSLVDTDVVVLIVQSDGALHAYKFNNGDANQTQDYVPIAGVVDHNSGAIASGDAISVVVQGLCKAKVYTDGQILTAGSPTAFLMIADEGTTAGAAGTFCSDHTDTTLAGTANVTDLDVDAQQGNFLRAVRGIFVGDTNIAASTTVTTGDVFVYNNPIALF